MVFGTDSFWPFLNDALHCAERDAHFARKKESITFSRRFSTSAICRKDLFSRKMLKLGIEEVRKMGFKGILVEGNFRFYNTVGFRTSSEYGIFPVSGYPMTEPRCQMCMETYDGSLKNRNGYVVYDMYYNA